MIRALILAVLISAAIAIVVALTFRAATDCNSDPPVRLGNMLLFGCKSPEKFR